MIVRVGGRGVWQRPFDQRNKNTMKNETKYNFESGGGWGGGGSNLTQGETSINKYNFTAFGVVLMIQVCGPRVNLVACKVRAP